MGGIKDLAARGFGLGAAEYERARPSYPEDAVQALVEALGIGPGETVLDVGAGTGKLTRMLVATGARLVPIEPVKAMRERLAEVLPYVSVVAGTAEALPFADGSAAAVVAAQAFHWFDPEPALREIHRVLSPGGGLGLLWNVRDESAGWVKGMSGIIDPYREAYGAGGPHGSAADSAASARMITGRWRPVLERSVLFSPLEERLFRHEQVLDPDSALARVLSISFVSILPPSEKDGVVGAMRELLATHPETAGRDRIVLPYRTHVFWCRAR